MSEARSENTSPGNSGMEGAPTYIKEGDTRDSRIKWLIVGVPCLMAVGWLLAMTFTAETPRSQVGRVFATGFFAILALFALGLSVRPQRDTRFQLINVTVLTRAERPTADSWVHFAQTRAVSLTTLLGFVVASLACCGMAVYAGLQAFGVIPQVNTDVSAAGPALAMLAMGAFGAGLAWLSSLMIRRQMRAGSVGARPSGVGLGATCVAVRVPGRDIEIPWTQIATVGLVAMMPQEGRSTPPMIRLKLSRGPVPDSVQMLALEGYRVPGSALYTALR